MEPGQKLMIIITSDDDADPLVAEMVKNSYPATKVSSTGGFLRKGNTTILSGVDADEVEGVVAIVRQVCRTRTEVVLPQPVAIPDFSSGTMPFEIRVGGATIFVLAVERFEKT